MPNANTPLRRLPLPVPPVANESATSYLRRLAAVNHVHIDDLEDMITIGKKNPLASRKRPVDPARLGLITGYSPGRLAEALPDLAERNTRIMRRLPRPRPACPSCVRRHRGGPVEIYLPDHRHVCIRHNIWLGSLGPANDAWPDSRDPVDVNPLPTVRAAQRCHQRLVRRYGEKAAEYAVRTAREVWDRANQTHFLGRHEWKLLEIFRPGAREVSTRDPLAHAIRYPSIVTIAGVLASPHWQQKASFWDTKQQAFDEIGRRIGQRDYGWHPWKRHPLTYWAEELEHERTRAGWETDRYRFFGETRRQTSTWLWTTTPERSTP
ncbi:TniQ protein [Saccharopolyspora antimicrobica]|uniref:TniQ protein n=2 Tax=Saccharopolyspora antimicrobica TaxID=455193 RepID=A0A1I4R8X0_9PSEU|nr:TniQ family protein [Saccharopolyspora antimicrobica]RKT88110.1 TniQ protein [Saccharopolyspora antimicrobica]SFM48754.1 TniQ protein [Saccharopolyspora antimicrobica]